MTTSLFVPWNQLKHAYGVASDIPEMLSKLDGFPPESTHQSEPWFSLWNSLCHQGDVYSASIAAVPKIVSVLASSPQRATLGFYLLPSCIAIADNSNSVLVSSELRHEFVASIKQLGIIASGALPNITDQNIHMAAQASMLVSQGDFAQAEALLDADA